MSHSAYAMDEGELVCSRPSPRNMGTVICCVRQRPQDVGRGQRAFAFQAHESGGGASQQPAACGDGTWLRGIQSLEQVTSAGPAAVAVGAEL